MTRAFIQLKINDLIVAGNTGQTLLNAVKDWINSQNIPDNDKVRIISDLNSYEGLEWIGQVE